MYLFRKSLKSPPAILIVSLFQQPINTRPTEFVAPPPPELTSLCPAAPSSVALREGSVSFALPQSRSLANLSTSFVYWNAIGRFEALLL
jgi:hypothetical protein